MRINVWPIRPLRDMLRPLARAFLHAERAAMAAQIEAVRQDADLQRRAQIEAVRQEADLQRRAQIEAVRQDAERQRRALEDARDLLAFEVQDMEGHLFERDILAMRHYGLAPVLADASLPQERRLAVCEVAILEGRLAEVRSTLEALHNDWVHRPTAARGLALCNHLLRSGLLRDLGWSQQPGLEEPRPLTRPLRFSPPGARDVVLVFLGADSRFWMQIAGLHPFLAPFGRHVVYLFDTQFSCFLRGIDGLGSSHETALGGLRALCRTLSESEAGIYCYGGSMGGFGALRYGLDLGARKVLTFGAPTSLKGDVCRVQFEIGLAKRLGALALDLKPLYLREPARPQVTLYYSALNARDTAHTQRFADVPGANIVAVEDTSDHDCLRKLVADGCFPDILAKFLDA
jgi:hypothetical protein